jgi:hypothetical protein
MKINNITKYRQAKLFAKELQEAVDILKNAMTSLEKYKKYDSVYDSILTLEATKIILEIHLRNQIRVMKNKGLE